MMRTAVIPLMALFLSCGKGEPTMTDKKPTPMPQAESTNAPVQLAASANGAVLEVKWTNKSGAAIHLATHVFAGEKHFDWLEVRLTDAAGAVRKLQFIDDRDESGVVVVALAPGASVSESIDLAAWAARTTNGAAPLARGTYHALVIYDSSGQSRAWAGRLEATTIVTAP
jgi:hypothetical protein